MPLPFDIQPTDTDEQALNKAAAYQEQVRRGEAAPMPDILDTQLAQWQGGVPVSEMGPLTEVAQLDAPAQPSSPNRIDVTQPREPSAQELMDLPITELQAYLDRDIERLQRPQAQQRPRIQQPQPKAQEPSPTDSLTFEQLKALSPEEASAYFQKKHGIQLKARSGAMTSFGKGVGQGIVKSTVSGGAKGVAALQSGVAGINDDAAFNDAERLMAAYDSMDGKSSAPFEWQGRPGDPTTDPIYQRAAAYQSADPATKAMMREQAFNEREAAQQGLMDITPTRDRAAYKFGQDVEKWTDKTIPMTQEEQGRFSGKAGQAIGSAGGYAALTAVPGIGPSLALGTGVAAQAGQGYDDAIQHGATERQANTAAMYNAPAGLIEILPAEKLLRLGKGGIDAAENLIKAYGREFVVNGIMEGGEEWVQQVWQNLIANRAVGYDPNRSSFEGAGEAALYGAVAGGALSAPATFMGRRNARAADAAPPPGAAPVSPNPADPTPPPPSAPAGRTEPQFSFAPEEAAVEEYLKGAPGPQAPAAAPQGPLEPNIPVELPVVESGNFPTPQDVYGNGGLQPNNVGVNNLQDSANNSPPSDATETNFGTMPAANQVNGQTGAENQVSPNLSDMKEEALPEMPLAELEEVVNGTAPVSDIVAKYAEVIPVDESGEGSDEVGQAYFEPDTGYTQMLDNPQDAKRIAAERGRTIKGDTLEDEFQRVRDARFQEKRPFSTDDELEGALNEALPGALWSEEKAEKAVLWALKNGRRDIATAIAERAQRQASATAKNTPGVDASHPKFGEIKDALAARKTETQEFANKMKRMVSTRQSPIIARSQEDLVEAGSHAASSPLNERPEPTDGQKQAGNYKKGHVNIHGLDISIETPRGGKRRGTDADGKPWEVEMQYDYGYVKGTTGKDGDHVDVYIGNNPKSERVFIVDQIDPATGKFDETKSFIGFDSAQDVIDAYSKAFSDGSASKRWRDLSTTTVGNFKEWLKNGSHVKGFGSTRHGQTVRNPRLKQAEEPVAAPVPVSKPKGKRPEKAKSLLEFISSRGGIEDPGGDLRSMNAELWHRQGHFRKRLLRDGSAKQGDLAPTGGSIYSPDDVALAAWDAGYFPTHQERPTVNELLDAMAEELRGNPRYSNFEEKPKKKAEEVEDQDRLLHDLHSHAQAIGVQVGEDWTPGEIIEAISEREAIQAEDAEAEAAANSIEEAIDDRGLQLYDDNDIPWEMTDVAPEAPAQQEAPRGDNEGREPGTQPGKEEGAPQAGERAGERGETPGEGGVEGTVTKLQHEALLARSENAVDHKREATGWRIVDTDNGSILVHPSEPKVRRFIAENTRSGTDVMRQRMTARAYASDNHVTTAPTQAGELVVKPIYDRTKLGDQTVILGAEKATEKTMAQRGADKPLKAKADQKPVGSDGGLFDTSASKQKPLFQRKEGKDAPTFYSALTRSVEAMKQAKAPAVQWKAAIKNTPGVKQEEVDWSGVNEWLDSQLHRSVTRQELVDYLRAAEPTVQEVVKEDKLTPAEAKRFDELTEANRREGLGDAERKEYDELGMRRYVRGGKPKFDAWQTDGGGNYREVLITLPSRAEGATGPRGWHSQNANEAAGDKNFRSQHWDEANVLAHVRFNDRTDADGKKTLFIEEVQSDWHQKGRKDGYTKRHPVKVTSTKSHTGATQIYVDGEPYAYYKPGQEADAEKTINTLREKGIEKQGGVPDAPFKTTWPELAMKRMIRWAVDNGYERVSWLPGEAQAERYDLSKQIDRIEYEPIDEPANTYEVVAYDKAGKQVLREEEIDIKRVEELVGKEVAKKIEAGEGEKRKGGYRNWHTLSGVDLQVGGEGMKGFYDKILPTTVQKYIKKWGGRVTSGDVDAGRLRQHYEGPQPTKAQIDKVLELSKIRGEDEMISPVTGEKQSQAINRATTNGVLNRVKDSMRDGASFNQAMMEHANEVTARIFGGELVIKRGSEKEKAHGFDITDEMRASVKEGQPIFQREGGKEKQQYPSADSNESPEQLAANLEATQQFGDALFRVVKTKPAWNAKERKLVRKITARGKSIFGDRFGVVASPLITDMEGHSVGGVYHGEYDGPTQFTPARGWAVIAMGKNEKPWKGLYHEGIHWLKAAGAFDNATWNDLRDMARTTWRKRYKIDKRYAEDAQARRDIGWPEDAVQAHLDEEAIAEAYAEFAHGDSEKGTTGRLTLTGRIKAAFEKILSFFTGVRRDLEAKGFSSWKEAFEDISTGKYRDTHGDKSPGRSSDGRTEQPRFSRKDINNGGLANAPFSVPDEGIFDALRDEKLDVFGKIKKGASKAALKASADSFRRKVQDRMIGVKRIQEAVEEATGKKLTGDQDVYQAEELFSGKVGDGLDHIRHQYYDPARDKLADLEKRLRADGAKENAVDYVEAYLIALHAEERNVQIAKINPKFPDGGSGMATADAKKIIADVEAGPYAATVKDVAKLVRKMNDESLALRYKKGLITKETYDTLRNTYKNYVSLKGQQELGTEYQSANTGKGYDTRGQEVKRAFGRKYMATDILAQSFAAAEEAVIRGEKNQVFKTLHSLVTKNPNEELWVAKPVETKPVLNKATGLVEYRTTAKRDGYRPDDTLIIGKIDGKQFEIQLKDNRLSLPLRNLEADKIDVITKSLMTLNRYLSTVNTGLNPDFILANAFRDLQTAGINLQQYDPKGLARKVGKTYLKAWQGTWGGLNGKEATDWQKIFADFQAAGGKVSFNRMDSIDRRSKALIRDIALLQGGAWSNTVRGAKATMNFIEHVNTTFDNSVRVAAFQAAREAGMSDADAASLAKNLTVNFNRRGEWGPVLNGMYLFFNANVQGTTILFQALRKSRKVQAVVGALMLQGFMMDMLNAMISPPDDDDQLLYDKIPAWEKNRNMIIMMPKGPMAEYARKYLKISKVNGVEYISIPMAHGYSAFYEAGRNMAAMARGAQKPGATLGNIAAGFVQAFSPVSASNLVSLVSPTFIRPAVDLTLNKDYKGDNIVPPLSDRYDANPPPLSQRYKKNASEISKFAAETLNGITGGTKIEPGAVDISPSQLDYLWAFYTGGFGNFLNKTFGKLAPAALGVANSDSEVSVRDLPVIGRTLGTIPPYQDVQRAYTRMEEYKRIRGTIEDYAKSGDGEGLKAYIQKQRDVMASNGVDMMKSTEATQGYLSQIRKARRELDAAGSKLTKEQVETAKANLRLLERQAVTAFNRNYNIVHKLTSKDTGIGQ